MPLLASQIRSGGDLIWEASGRSIRRYKGMKLLERVTYSGSVLAGKTAGVLVVME